MRFNKKKERFPNLTKKGKNISASNVKKLVFNKFVRTINIEKTFFVYREIPDKINLNQEIIKLNYAHLAPDKNSEILYYKEHNMLYLWFFKNETQQKLLIPEGFIVFKNFSKEKECIILNKKDNLFSVTVIKRQMLVSQFLTKKDKSNIISIIKKEYGMKNPRIVEINNEKYADEVQTLDILSFLLANANIDAKKILKELYEDLKTPIIIILLMINLLSMSLYAYTNILIANKTKELNILKQKSEKIKKQFDYMDKEATFFSNFFKNELSRPSVLTILNVIGKSLKKNKGILIKYESSYNNITIWVVADSISKVVNSLMSTGLFNNVQVISISSSSKYKHKKVGNMSITLKVEK